MALQNPSNLYTAGAVVVDQPNLNIYASHLARKQAREEALNQYFTELGDKINTAGVRMQDLSGPQGGINNDISAWRQNWMANKEAIKRGGMAQQEHMAKLNQIQRRIAQSKERAKTELEIGKAKFEGKYDPDDDDLGVLGKIGYSIYDPRSYKQDGVSEYGWQDLSPSVKDFDAKAQNEFWMAASRGMKPGKVYDEANMRLDKTTGKAFVPFKEVYSQEQIKKIADDAMDLVSGSREARKYYNKILDSPTMEPWKRLNDAYQSVYGKDKQVSTPEQAAQADMILKASGVFDSGEQLVTDQDLAWQRRMDAMIANSNLIASRAAGGGSNDPNNANIIDSYNEIESAFGKGTKQIKRGQWGRVDGISLSDLTPKTQKSVLSQANAIAGNQETDPNDPDKVKGAKFYQDDIYLSKEGNKYYMVDLKTNQKIAPLDFESVNLPVQPSVKEKREVIQIGKNRPATRPSSATYHIKGKDYSEADLLKMGYTLDQIKAYKK